MQNEASKSNKRNFSLLLLVFALPVIASYLAYYVWPPQGGVRNYGELIAPVSLTQPISLSRPDGGALTTQDLRGKWVLVFVHGGECDAGCEKKLYALRQARLLQGRERDRVLRLWVVNDKVAPTLAQFGDKYQGTWVAIDATGALSARLPAPRDVREHIYIIDPLGNIMMRYPADPDLKRLQKDLGTLLRASQIG